jgi:DNA-directed RNA polymerase specialized sigma24 family protein
VELKKQAKERLAASYNLHYKSLYRFCNSRLKNEHQAEDCVQECFLVLYKKYMQNAQIENEKLFLYKVADNLIK